MTAPQYAILCDSLTRDFGSIRALDGLTLAVPTGAIFAFLGPNGAGKTTTIHLLLGIIEPTAGTARVLGFDPVTAGDPIRRRSGALLEHSGLYERLSAVENLRYYARIAHLGAEETEARIAELLTQFGLYDRRDDTVGKWSRGMKQKLAIARVLLHKPSLVFLDEPTSGLDPESTVALREHIVSLGTTVFLTTHNLTDVEKMATHVAVIREGRLLDAGTPAELRARAVRSRVTIRMQDREPLAMELAPGESAAPIVARLVHEGAQIEEVRREEPSLEEVFLHLVRSGVRQQSCRFDSGGEAAALQSPRPPLFRDIGTVIRKELREMTSTDSVTTKRVNLIAVAVMLLIAAGLAAIAPPGLIHSPAALGASFIAFMILLSTVSDSFAGERERHTLETILASAIPDVALLLGKILAGVLYGWSATLVVMTVLLLGANVTHFPILYPPSVILSALVLTPLALIFFCTAGVLASLRAPTVREAQVRLAALLFGLLLPPLAVRPLLPLHWRDRAVATMQSESGRLTSALVQIAFFVAADLALLALAAARFRRGKLIAR